MRAFLSLLIVGLAMAMANFGVNSQTITITDEHLSKEFVAQTLADLLLSRVLEKREEQLGRVIPQQDQDVRIPILPPTIITLPFEDYRLVFENQLMQGYYEHEDTELTLSIRDNLSFGLNGSFVTVRYAFNMDELAVAGNYSMNFNLNFTYLDEVIPDFPIEVGEGLEVPIEGWGGYELVLEDFTFTVALAIEIMPNNTIVSVTALVEALSLGGVRIHFDNFMFNNYEGEPVLDIINQLLNSQLVPVVGMIRPTIEDLLNLLVKQLPLEGCVLSEMIGGDLSCLGIPTQPPPPPTTPSTTTTSSTPSTKSTPSPPTSTTPTTTTNSAVNYGGASFGSMLATLMMMMAVSRLF